MTSAAIEADRRLEGALRERGHRVTSQRLLIHRALQELDRHATAEEVLAAVADRLPNVSLPTVYATLDLLEELGAIRRVHAGSGPTLYDPRVEEHHHLVCRRCGGVEDVDASLDLGPALRAARRGKLAPDGGEVILTGLCAACAAAS